ncbi:MAG: hypothetical protein ABL963_06885 [Longimicrobiales bacterium]
MDRFVRDVYVSEIETQCRLARNAAGSIDDAVAATHETGTHEVFRALHSLLTHASNVSRLLWPSQPKKYPGEAKGDYRARAERIQIRGDELRTLLHLPGRDGGGHVLFDRTLRDHLEHFDERLEEWERTSKGRNMIQDALGPRSAIVAVDETDVMRWYDPRAGTFYFRHESFNIRGLCAATEEILVRAIRSLSDPREVESKLSEEFPDMVFSWSALQMAVGMALGQDPRVAGRLRRAKYGLSFESVEVEFGGDVFQVALPAVTVPGSRSQVGPIVEKIVAAVTGGEAW